MLLAPSMTDMTDFNVAGTDLATVRSKYAVLVYVKYVPGLVGNRIGFSLQDGSGATPHSPEIFYGSTIGDPIAPGDNTIQSKLHKFADGEWISIAMRLNQVIYAPSNPAALTRFMVWKLDNAATFDLTITKPVLIYVGSAER